MRPLSPARMPCGVDLKAPSVDLAWLNLFAFVEMNLGESKDSDYGQALGYLLLMSKWQPGRKYFVGMLSNAEKNEILVLSFVPNHQYTAPHQRSRNLASSSHVTRHGCISFEVALSVLLHYSELPDYIPPASPFFPNLGCMEGLVGNPRKAMVGILPAPPDKNHLGRGRSMAVKVAARQHRGFDVELKVLKKIVQNRAPDYLPWSTKISNIGNLSRCQSANHSG